jgi:hypothetical protein
MALLSQPSIVKAAKASKIPLRTIQEWLRVPAFRTELQRAQSAMFEAAVVGLTRATEAAVAALVKNLAAKGLPGVQVRAAKVLLDKAIQVRGMADLASEVAELRASLERVNGNAAGPESRSGTDPEAGPRSNGPAQPDAGPPAGEPDPPVRGDGLEAGSVADGIPSCDVIEELLSREALASSISSFSAAHSARKSSGASSVGSGGSSRCASFRCSSFWHCHFTLNGLLG